MTSSVDQIVEFQKTQMNLGWQLTRLFWAGVRDLWRVQMETVTGVVQENAKSLAQQLDEQAVQLDNGIAEPVDSIVNTAHWVASQTLREGAEVVQEFDTPGKRPGERAKRGRRAAGQGR